MSGELSWRVLVVAFVLGLAVAVGVGCGDDDSGSNGGSAPAAGGGGGGGGGESLIASGHTKQSGDTLEVNYEGLFHDLIPKTGPVKVPDDARYIPLGLISPDQVTKEWRTCYFAGGLTDIYYIQGQRAAEQVTQDLGVELKFFNAEFDPTRMLNQIENAIARDECDLMVAQPLDPATVCKALTEDAQQADIPVVIINAAICGDDTYTEGTVAFESFPNVLNARLLLETAFKEFSEQGGGKLGLILAHETFSLTIAQKEILKELEPQYPDIDVVQILNGDFTPESGLKAAQTMINTHPDLKGLYSAYDQMTAGAVKALKTAGKKPGDLSIWSSGADHSGLELMRDGWLDWAGFTAPLEETAHGIEAGIAHLEGKKVPEFINEGNTIIRPDDWKSEGNKIKTDSRLET